MRPRELPLPTPSPHRFRVRKTGPCQVRREAQSRCSAICGAKWERQARTRRGLRRHKRGPHARPLEYLDPVWTPWRPIAAVRLVHHSAPQAVFCEGERRDSNPRPPGPQPSVAGARECRRRPRGAGAQGHPAPLPPPVNATSMRPRAHGAVAGRCIRSQGGPVARAGAASEVSLLIAEFCMLVQALA